MEHNIQNDLGDIKLSLNNLEQTNRSLSTQIDDLQENLAEQNKKLNQIEIFISKVEFFRDLLKYAVPVLAAVFFLGLWVNDSISDKIAGLQVAKGIYTAIQK